MILKEVKTIKASKMSVTLLVRKKQVAARLIVLPHMRVHGVRTRTYIKGVRPSNDSFTSKEDSTLDNCQQRFNPL